MFLVLGELPADKLAAVEVEDGGPVGPIQIPHHDDYSPSGESLDHVVCPCSATRRTMLPAETRCSEAAGTSA